VGKKQPLYSIDGNGNSIATVEISMEISQDAKNTGIKENDGGGDFNYDIL
jgi:hypothetical protein